MINGKLESFIKVHQMKETDEVIKLNNVILEGYVTQMNEIKVTNAGNKVLSFVLANNKHFDDIRHTAYYIPVIVWNEDAERLSTCLPGTRIIVNGRYQSRNYIKDDVEHYYAEVSAKSMKIIKERNANEDGNQGNVSE